MSRKRTYDDGGIEARGKDVLVYDSGPVVISGASAEQAISPITCTIKDALAMSGLGKTKLFELIAAGRVQTVKVGARRLVRMDSLRELLVHNPVHKSNADLDEPRRTAAAIEREIIKKNQRKANRGEPGRT